MLCNNSLPGLPDKSSSESAYLQYFLERFLKRKKGVHMNIGMLIVIIIMAALFIIVSDDDTKGGGQNFRD